MDREHATSVAHLPLTTVCTGGSRRGHRNQSIGCRAWCGDGHSNRIVCRQRFTADKDELGTGNPRQLPVLLNRQILLNACPGAHAVPVRYRHVRDERGIVGAGGCGPVLVTLELLGGGAELADADGVIPDDAEDVAKEDADDDVPNAMDGDT